VRQRCASIRGRSIRADPPPEVRGGFPDGLLVRAARVVARPAARPARRQTAPLQPRAACAGAHPWRATRRRAQSGATGGRDPRKCSAPRRRTAAPQGKCPRTCAQIPAERRGSARELARRAALAVALALAARSASGLALRAARGSSGCSASGLALRAARGSSGSQRSPGCFFGYCDTGWPTSSAVVMMRSCSCA